jgi:hypothetical protein
LAYSPTPESNIYWIYSSLKTKPTSLDKLQDKIRMSHPLIDERSIATHLRFLIKKGLVVKSKENGKNHYAKSNGIVAPAKTKGTSSTRVLDYCKTMIGKHVDSVSIKLRCGFSKKDTAPATMLGILAKNGYLQKIDGHTPYSYLVLPQIKTCEKIPSAYTKNPIAKTDEKQISLSPAQTEQVNIANMSMGTILQEYVTLKMENTRLREALQRIAHELVQVGEIE